MTTTNDTVVVEASFAQQSLWLLDQVDPGQPTYNVLAAVRLRGPLDVAALREALNAVVARHEPLRTAFDFDGYEPVQVISSSLTIELPVTDVAAEDLDGLIQAEVERPFDLRETPLLRMRLLRTDEREHVAVLVMHHIITDGFSCAILFQELAACYDAYVTGRRPLLPELRVQYADYAVWQRETLQGEVLDDHLGYWGGQLAGITPLLLPTDLARPAAPTSAGATYAFPLPDGYMARLEKMARDWDVTPFMLVLAAFSVLLARYSDRTDFTIATPVAGRHQSQIAGLIGFFVNTLALRMDLSGDPTFGQLLARVRQTCLAAYAHQEVPYEKLVEELRPTRYNGNGGPLAQVMFSLMNVPQEEWRAGDLTFEGIPVATRTAKFDLSLDISPAGKGYLASLEYSTELFRAARIELMAGHLITLLDAVLSDADRRVSELPMLTAAERVPARPRPNRGNGRAECVHRHFERQAAATPDAVAVLCGRHRLSYGDLDRRANALAHRLHERGVRAETPVAVLLPRSADLIVAFLAVLKAGGAYVPADPAYPAERLAYMVTDSGATHAITTTELAAALPAVVTDPVLVDGPRNGPPTADSPPDAETDPGQLAYIVYTSGSTGHPKGAMTTHRGLAGFALAMSGALGLDGTDRALQLAPLGFDVVAEEVYPYLLTGGSVALPEGAAPLSAGELWRTVEATGATSLSTTPSRLLSWGDRERAAVPAVLRRLIFGSEAAPALRNLLPWQGWRGDLVQAYGVTEASCTSSVQPVDFTADPDLIVPLGEALPSAELYVLDEWLNPAPAGVPGELYIGGVTVGRGYVGRPGLTAERFVPDPYGVPGERLYRTGDIARRSSAGFQFIGRTDEQVKIRGIRIEPAEVEAALGQQPDVAGCAVVARPDPQGASRLIGYVVSRPGTNPSTAELRAFLGERLPEWMVPSVFVSLPELPVGDNGKIDRAALTGTEGAGGGEEQYVPPRTPIEHELARIWAELLGQDRVGVESNFFYLGGNSLAAVRMVAEIRERLGVELPMRTLFGIEPTIAVLSEQIFGLLAAEEVG